MHINNGCKVGVDAQLLQPFCLLCCLCKSYTGVPTTCHLFCRWQVAMKFVETIDQTALLICGNQERNMCIAIGLLRKGANIALYGIWAVKVAIAFLIYESTNILLCNHIL